MTRYDASKQPKKQILCPSGAVPIHNHREELLGIKFSYTIHNKQISVMVSYDAPPEYEQRDNSVPGEYLDRYEEAGWWSDNAVKRMDLLFEEMEEIIRKVCYNMLMELAGSSPPPPMPARRGVASEEQDFDEKGPQRDAPAQTLYEYMYPDISLYS